MNIISVDVTLRIWQEALLSAHACGQPDTVRIGPKYCTLRVCAPGAQSCSRYSYTHTHMYTHFHVCAPPRHIFVCKCHVNAYHVHLCWRRPLIWTYCQMQIGYKILRNLSLVPCSYTVLILKPVRWWKFKNLCVRCFCFSMSRPTIIILL